VISFNWDSMKRVRSAYPELPTGLNVATADAILDAVGLCLDDGHGILVPNAAIDDSLLSQGVEAGIRVFPWTVNDPTRAGELAALGVSGIITNVPDLISEAL
jgi:glycerophosphoryl diester phosphodiesterase